MKKLFENVGGNKFKLITESISEPIKGSDLVREGLKKVFANSDIEVSYHRLANVGLGYIKDITEAKKCAIQEAREIASDFGFQDDEYNQKFIKI